MSDKDLNINLNIDSEGLDGAGQKLDGLGEKAVQSTTHVGSLRKELRATGEASKVAGEAFGGAGGALGSVGEGGRIAYAGMELMNGGLKTLATTILANPIFLLATIIAVVVTTMISLNKESEKSDEEFKKAKESGEKFSETLRGIQGDAQTSADELAVLNGTMTELDKDLAKSKRKSNDELLKLNKQYASDVKDLQDAAFIEEDKRTDYDREYGENKSRSAAELIKKEAEYHEAVKSLTQEAVSDLKIIKKKSEIADAKDKEKATKKSLDDSKKAAADRLKKAQELYKAKQTEWKLLIAQTKTGTQENLDVTVKSLDDENTYIENNFKKLGMTKDEELLLIQDNNNKKLKLQTDFSDNFQKVNDKLMADAAKEVDKQEADRVASIAATDDQEIKNLQKSLKNKQDVVKTTGSETLAQIKDIEDNEIALEEAKYKKLVDLGQGGVEARKNEEDAITEIHDKAAKDRADIRAVELTSAGSFVSGLGSLGQLMSSNAKEAYEINKDVALLQLGVDTAKAISSLVSSSTANPLNSVTFGAAGIAQFAAGLASVLANMAQAKQLLSTGYSGTVTAATSKSSGSSTANKPATNSPANSFTAPQFFGLGQGGNQGSNPPQKVYVSETDITNTQNRVAVIQNRSTQSL